MSYTTHILLDTFKPLASFGGSVYTIDISIGDVEQNGVIHTRKALCVKVDFVEKLYEQVFKGHDMVRKASNWLTEITQREWTELGYEHLEACVKQTQ